LTEQQLPLYKSHAKPWISHPRGWTGCPFSLCLFPTHVRPVLTATYLELFAGLCCPPTSSPRDVSGTTCSADVQTSAHVRTSMENKSISPFFRVEWDRSADKVAGTFRRSPGPRKEVFETNGVAGFRRTRCWNSDIPNLKLQRNGGSKNICLCIRTKIVRLRMSSRSCIFTCILTTVAYRALCWICLRMKLRVSDPALTPWEAHWTYHRYPNLTELTPQPR
jgi:hypothetical protein